MSGSLPGEGVPHSPAFWVAPVTASSGLRPDTSVTGQTGI